MGLTQCEGPQDTAVDGLVLEGAAWGSDGDGASGGGLRLSDVLRCQLPPSRLRWRQRGDGSSGAAFLRLPLYLNEARSVLVAEVLVPAPAVSGAAGVWAQRGVAVILKSF